MGNQKIKKIVTRILSITKRGFIAKLKLIINNLTNQKDNLNQLNQMELEIKEEHAYKKIQLIKDDLFRDKKVLLTKMKCLEQDRMEFENFQTERIHDLEMKMKLATDKFNKIEERKKEEQIALEIIKNENEKLLMKKKKFRDYAGKRQLELSLQRAKFEIEKKRYKIDIEDQSEIKSRNFKTISLKNVIPKLEEIIGDTIVDEENIEIKEPVLEPLFEDQTELVENVDNNEMLSNNVEPIEMDEGINIDVPIKSTQTIKKKIPKMRNDIEKQKLDENLIRYDGTQWIPIPFDIEICN